MSKDFRCEICSRVFMVKPSRYKKYPPRFCSWRCFSQKLTKECLVCGKKYLVQRWNKGTKYCSNKCHGKVVSKKFSGSGSHTWKGGVTPQRVIDRNTPELREWKKLVFRKDGFSCVLCERHGGYLVADHFPFPFHKYPEKRTDPNNGRTLCLDCNKTVTYKDRIWANA